MSKPPSPWHVPGYENTASTVVYIWRLEGADIRRCRSKSVWKIGISVNGDGGSRAKTVARGLGGQVADLFSVTSDQADLLETYLLCTFNERPHVTRITDGWTELRVLSDAEASTAMDLIQTPPDDLKKRVKAQMKKAVLEQKREDELEDLLKWKDVGDGLWRPNRQRWVDALHRPRPSSTVIVVPEHSKGSRPIPSFWWEEIPMSKWRLVTFPKLVRTTASVGRFLGSKIARR